MNPKLIGGVMCKLEDWLSVQEPGTQCSPACDSPEDILTSLRRIGASDQQREVADLISTESKWIETLFSFAHYIFKGLTGDAKIRSDMGSCLPAVLHCLMCWTDQSKFFCCTVLKQGAIFNVVEMLTKLRTATHSEFVCHLTVTCIGLIYNCVRAQEDLFQVYCNKVAWVSLLQPWIASSQIGIKLHTLFFFGFLAPYLSESDHRKVVSNWAKEDVDNLLDMLKLSTSSPNFTAKFNGIILSADELLVNILNLARLSKEYIAVAGQPKLFHHYICLLQKGSQSIRLHTCQLLWTLCNGGLFIASEPALIKAVESLCISSEWDDSLIAKCLLTALKRGSNHSGHSCVYAEGCYRYKHYEECSKEISGLLPAIADEEEKIRMILLKGKACFYSYLKENKRFLANSRSMPPHNLFAAHEACFARAKEVILLLGEVLDSGHLDEEGSKILDLAMLEYIIETNKLIECHRCYLCRKNLATKSIPVGEKNEAKSAVGKEKLIASHVYPRAILDRFASSIPLPKGKKVFDDIGPAAGRREQLVKTAKESNFYMLCHQCEDTLNKHGEKWFLVNFFDKLYDTTNPENSRCEQSIPYTSQLYMFCVGLIFRTLKWEMDSFVNSDECYQLLLQCRHCLLNPHSLSSIDQKPAVYLFMSPLSAAAEDLKHGFMNQVLTCTCISNIAHFNLETGTTISKTSVKAHFLNVHVGMFNILVKFSPSALVDIESQYLVNPNGGIYHVPSEEKRKKILPKGIWSVFEYLASEFEQSWYEHLNKPYLLAEKQEKVIPDSKSRDAFGVLSGILQEMSLLKSGPSPSTQPDQLKIVNLLPQSFDIHLKGEDIIIPEGHKLLLHKTFQQSSDGSNVTLFLCVGQMGSFTLDKPYVLWHSFTPGLQTSFGFFLSTENLKGTEFLPDRKEKFYLVNANVYFKEIMNHQAPVLLRKLLVSKGFFSMKSLLSKMKSLKNLPPVDRPCDVHCWYCINRCSNCLQLANPEYTVTEEGKRKFYFCSKMCKRMCTKTDEEMAATTLFVVTPKGEVFGLGQQSSQSEFFYRPRCCPISDSHSILVHVFIQAESSKGYPVEKELVLCVSDGTEGVHLGANYVVQWSRSLLSQFFLEYLVTSDFSPEAPLHYLADDPAALESTKVVKRQGDVQVCLQRAIKAVTEHEKHQGN